MKTPVVKRRVCFFLAVVLLLSIFPFAIELSSAQVGTGIQIGTGFGDVYYVAAAFTWTPGNPSIDQNITFTAQFYNSTSVSWYYWALGDATTYNSTSNEITHAYNNTGSYNVTLIENSNLGNSTITLPITVGSVGTGKITGFWLWGVLASMVAFPTVVFLLLNRRKKH